MIDMFISMADSLFSTDESIATPCSVKAKGIYRVPPLLFEDAICDLKLSNSSFVNSNMKSLGKRLRFLLTASFSRLVSLP